MNLKNLACLLLGGFFFAACDNNTANQPEEITCSTIFKMVTLEVKGPPLDSFYTLCLSTNQLIEDNPPMSNNIYPVLSDRFQGELANRQDSFQFIGILNDSIVISEIYEIAADACHINYVSGKRSVEL